MYDNSTTMQQDTCHHARGASGRSWTLYWESMSDNNEQLRLDDESGSWLKELSDAAIPSSTPPKPAEEAAPEPVIELPPLERTRPRRPPLVPQWVWISAGVGVVAIALAIAAVATISAMSRVAVPDVTGTALGVAQARLGQLGLKASIAEKRFSTLPADQVISQSPGFGAQAQRGDTVSLVVSGGSEEFNMPDVVGDGVTLAKGLLEAKGLLVQIEEVISEDASDTVMTSMPAAGATVRTGDTVRLQVSTPRVSGVKLQPYSLKGVGILIDPSAPIAGATDASLDVARRLSALLEASGASVTLLRQARTARDSDSDRSNRAAESTASVAVGLTVKATGQSGRIVAYSSTAAVSEEATSGALAETVAVELARSAPPAATQSVGGDNVFDAVRIPWVRVTLGSASQRADQSAFEDPDWADAVARSVYAALGKLYGVVVQP